VAERGVPVSREDAAAAAGRPAKHYVRADRQIEAAKHTAPDGDPDHVLLALRQAVADRGYEPFDDADGAIQLRHCPFDRIAAHHRPLICGANLAMLQGLADHLGGDPPVGAVMDPQPGRCCIVLAHEG
jgi:predicted ArsR family transcriptional regulator